MITGLLTVTAALSYGELAAMLPTRRRPVRLSARSLVAVVGLLVRLDAVSGDPDRHRRGRRRGVRALPGRALAAHFGEQLSDRADPISNTYAISLSTAQLVGIVLILLLSWTNARGIQYGKIVQNIFTCTKIGSLLAVIALGIFVGWNAVAVKANFTDMWTPRDFVATAPGLTPATAFGLFVAIAVAQVGSLFSADAWNNITFTAGEVKNPQRNVPLSLALGTLIVIGLYMSCQCRLRRGPAFGPGAARAVRPRGAAHAPSDFPGCRRRADGAGDHDLDVRLHQRHGHVRRASLLRHGARRPVLSACRER